MVVDKKTLAPWKESKLVHIGWTLYGSMKYRKAVLTSWVNSHSSLSLVPWVVLFPNIEYIAINIKLVTFINYCMANMSLSWNISPDYSLLFIRTIDENSCYKLQMHAFTISVLLLTVILQRILHWWYWERPSSFFFF